MFPSALLRDSGDGLDFVYFLQVATDGAHVFHVVDFEVDFCLEDAFGGLNGKTVHVNVQLLGQNAGNLEKHTLTVDAFDTDGGREVEPLVGVPPRREDSVAVGHLQTVGFGAVALMYGDTVALVEVP